MKLHIKNGRLMDPKNGIDEPRDLLIEDGRVMDVLSSNQKISDIQTIDATGFIVAPGFIDLHTHLREPGFEYRETIESGTKAAARGGFTSICCMANTYPVNDEATITDFILQKAKEKGLVNVYPIGALTKGLEGKELAPIGELIRAGCIALSDDGNCVQNNQLARFAMEYARSFDVPVITHAIDPILSADGVMNESYASTILGLGGIPNEAEDIMIARDICLARLTGAKLHVAHVSTEGGVEFIKQAKERGLKVTCEVTPHHLTLTDEAVLGYRTQAKMLPPLRSERDREALCQALSRGIIDAIATDHAPHSATEKECEFEQAKYGIIGLETALSICMQLVENKKISLFKLIESLTVNPAQISGLKNKGSFHKGADADIVIFDPKAQYIIDASEFCSKSKNSPFIGMKVKGKVYYTIVGGRVVFNHDKTSSSYLS